MVSGHSKHLTLATINLGDISPSIDKTVKRTCRTKTARNLNKTCLKDEAKGKELKS
jgi:hypothetical protein